MEMRTHNPRDGDSHPLKERCVDSDGGRDSTPTLVRTIDHRRSRSAEVIELGELKAYRAEIQQRRQALQEQQAQYEAEVDHLKSASDRVDQLIDYCARVQSRLQTFSCAEKRIALQALDIQVAWAAEQPLTVQGSIPVDGAIVSSTVNGVMRPPFSAGSNQAGGT
jgi:hypothetical protein